MANLVTDYFDPAELTDLAREIQAADFESTDTAYTLQRTVLAPQLVDDIEYRLRPGANNIPSSAKFRAFDSENPVGNRPGFSELSGALLPLGQRHFLSELDRLKLRKAGAEAFQRELAACTRDATMATIVRMELAVVQTLLTGKTTLTNERGVTQEADWGRNANRSVTAPVLWTDTATSKPLTDLRNWVDLYDGDCRIIMSKQTFGLLPLNEQFRTLASVSNVGTPDFVTQDFVRNVLQANGIGPIELYDAKYMNDAGVETRVLPTKNVLIVPTNSSAGRTVWGVTAEAIDPEYGIPESEWPGIVAGQYENPHPKQRWVNVAAVGFPVLANPDKTITAVVTA